MTKKPTASQVARKVRQIIPKGMSVTAAALRLGVSRPALSSVLNGRAALSPDMAHRLERSFGANAGELLEAQAAIDRDEQREDARAVGVRSYAPPFLAIRAHQIERWADAVVEARSLFPVLLRKLAHSTGVNLRSVDFPGHDNAQRRGPDGIIESDTATAWIPKGKSYWEFGTDGDPKRKANADYAARTSSVPKATRQSSTYVQVTPRNWPAKTSWQTEKLKSSDWKAVRALDASDLEQWLEESVPGQMWLADQLVLTVDGLETLERRTRRWREEAVPPLSPELFAQSVATHRRVFEDWVSQPSDRPFVIVADSKDEALAFLAAMLLEKPVSAVEDSTSSELRRLDVALVFSSGQALRKLHSASTTFFAIATTDEAEREVATIYRERHCIIVRPRNAVDREPDIALEPLGHEAFKAALALMGIVGEDADRLSRDTGHSPTILRRRLSVVDAIRIPTWATDHQTARCLVPMAFVGAWHASSKADREILEVLAGRPYAEIEADIARLLPWDDSPVWSAGEYRGVASKTDALFAVSGTITRDDLTRFLEFADYVLGEADPALQLPEDQQWAAAVYSKVRDHSATLRSGICETLVFLAVHGNHLFQTRLGLDVNARVSCLIGGLLTPFSLDVLRSHDSDLPRYAEAAPDDFLSILETDLKQDPPVVFGLLKPADSGLTGRCLRTGLLWALEALAWAPHRLSRVVMVLARLSAVKIDDNWANKPIASLEAIFRCWMPQTAAPATERIAALRLLVNNFPDIGWRVCVEQFRPHGRWGMASHRPQWRNDASGAGQPVPREEARQFARACLDIAIAWPAHSERTLGDLVECLEDVTDADQQAIWNCIEHWLQQADDLAKAALRERVRRLAFTRRAHRRQLTDPTRTRARSVYERLEPADVVIRHAWLFADQWLDVAWDEPEDGEPDYTKRHEQVHQLRLAAIREIWDTRGPAGTAALLPACKTPFTVGLCAASCVTTAEAAVQALLEYLGLPGPSSEAIDGLLEGFLAGLDETLRLQVMSRVQGGLNPTALARIFRCAPFGEKTWRLLENQTSETQADYWEHVQPRWSQFSEAELTELVDHLLEARRPRTAFLAAEIAWDRVETSRLKRLLGAVVTINEERAGTYLLDRHHIAEALTSLARRPGVSSEEMAGFEFIFLDALDHTEHGIKNLERQVAEVPGMFAQAVGLAYKRRDGRPDPPELQFTSPEHHKNLAMAAFDMLRRLTRIPGLVDDGVDAGALARWVHETRRLCAEYGRETMGDQMIGQLLSHAPRELDGMWPCRPVCEVMESVGSHQMAKGFCMGVHNGRGFVWRGEDGVKDRELAEQYRGWARHWAFEFPFVSATLESVAALYDREAEREDSEARIRRRLQH